MTQPPPILSYARPRPAVWCRPGWFVSWAIILGAIVFVAFRQNAPARPANATGPSVQFRLAARYAIGIRALYGDANLPLYARQTLQQSIDSLAKTPEDRIRAAIVAGELLGSDEARRRVFPFHQGASSFPEPVDTDNYVLERIYEAGPDALAPAQRVDLIERHGWFARLALTSHLVPSDPARRAVLAPALRTAIALLSLVVVIAVASIGGLALFIVAIVLLAKRKLPARFVLPPAELLHPTALLEPLAVFLAIYLGLGYVLRVLADYVPALSFLSTLSACTLFLAAPSAIAWPLLRGVRVRDWRTALGLHGNPLREIPVGLVGYVAGMPLFILGILATFVLIRLSNATPTHPATEFATSGSPLAILGIYLLASVWAPITEELLFRGSLFSHLRLRHAFLVSAALNSVLFAAIHPQGWTLIPALGSLAFIFSALRHWRGSIIAPMTAHALHNTALITLLLVLVS